MGLLPLAAISYPQACKRLADTVSCPDGVADSRAEEPAEFSADSPSDQPWKLRREQDAWSTFVSRVAGADSGGH